MPGHGEPCEQGQIVANWVGYVERLVERGIGAGEALRGPIEVKQQDPYPIGRCARLSYRGHYAPIRWSNQ